jgi:hypothetical protein
MLVIRKEQMAVLEACMAERFRDSVRKHLRTELREETRPFSDAQIRPMIEEGIRRGRQYGVTTERDLTLFVDLIFLHSPKFEDAPDMKWAKKVLLNRELEGDVKMSLIYQRLAARQASPETSETKS